LKFLKLGPSSLLKKNVAPAGISVTSNLPGPAPSCADARPAATGDEMIIITPAIAIDRFIGSLLETLQPSHQAARRVPFVRV
jgi:hypothetical protein